MPNVMIRKNKEEQLVLYIAKRDQEETVASIEFDDEKWGGEVVLTDGSSYYIEPMDSPKLPITVRAKRLVVVD